MPKIQFELVGNPIKLTTPIPQHVVVTSDIVYRAWNIVMPYQPKEYAVGIVGRHTDRGIYETTHTLEMGVLKNQQGQPLQSAFGIELESPSYIREMVESGADALGYRIVGVFHSHPPRNQRESSRDMETVGRWRDSFIGAVLSPERTVKFFGRMPHSINQKDGYRLRNLGDNFYELTDNREIFFEREVPAITELRRRITQR